MLANDIKKGMKVITKDGLTAEVEDNKKGIIRMIRSDLSRIYGPGASSLGDTYVFTWKYVEVNGKWEKVELTTGQQSQAARIQAAGFGV